MAINPELEIPLGIDWKNNVGQALRNGVNKFREIAPSFPVRLGNYPELNIEGVTPLDKKARAAAEFLSWIFVPKIVTLGAENFKKAELLPEKYAVFIVANHLSMADFPVAHQAIVRRGMSEQANRMVPLVGKKEENENIVFENLSKKEKLNQFLMGAYQFVWVYSPKRDCSTTSERNKRRQINSQASKTVERLILNGKHPVFTPEATRSKGGEGLLEGEPLVAEYFRLAQSLGKIAVAVPVAVWGTEKIWPPESGFPVRPGIATVSCGEPVEIPRFRGNFPLGQYRKNTEEIMKRIAIQLPPPYRGVYTDRV